MLYEFLISIYHIVSCRNQYSTVFLDKSNLQSTLGARVILACRDKKRGETALSEVIKRSGNQQVFLKMLDLASLESVRNFAEDVNRTEPRLDILLNNAGKNLEIFRMNVC